MTPDTPSPQDMDALESAAAYFDGKARSERAVEERRFGSRAGVDAGEEAARFEGYARVIRALRSRGQEAQEAGQEVERVAGWARRGSGSPYHDGVDWRVWATEECPGLPHEFVPVTLVILPSEVNPCR